VIEVHYPVGKVARALGVHPKTLDRWCDAGKVRCIRTPGGHRRIPASEVRRLISPDSQFDSR
jgi:excisionase family DNA binding protein